MSIGLNFRMDFNFCHTQSHDTFNATITHGVDENKDGKPDALGHVVTYYDPRGHFTIRKITIMVTF